LNISRTSGFTLIELVIVIILLGILSAVAVPKFMNLSLDAKNAALRSLKGTIESGLSIAHNKMIIDGEANNTDVLPKFCNECEANGAKNYLFDYGYPQDAYGAFPLLFSDMAGSLESSTDSTDSTWVVTPYFGENWIYSRNKNSNTGCYLIYTAPTSSNKTYELEIVDCE